MDLPSGSPSYVMRELDREPDERIAALEAQRSDLNRQLFDCAKKHDPEIENVRTKLSECGKTLEQLHRAPDRVRRLLHLLSKAAFSEWLAIEQKNSPTILRYGVPVPPAEQDGYYQKDYEEWRNAGSPHQPQDSGQVDLDLRQENGVWHAKLRIQTSAIGRSRELAEQNARLKAECLACSRAADANSKECSRSENV
jgi:hypothetical protein